jgi:tripartite-type tricarboxylate transporter receptor subunit TctC
MKKVTFAIALALCLVICFAQAQTFPTRPVTFLIPYPPGGTTDVAARALAAATEKHLGQPIIIENKPGATGTLAAAQMAATAKPDGYTVALIPISVFRLPFLNKTTFNPSEDFSYIIRVTGYTYGVVVKADAPWKTFEEFLADAKTNPGKVSYGTAGSNSSQHIAMSLIAKQRGIEWVHVPFRGTPDEVNAVLGGHVHAIADPTGWAPQVNSGQLRLLITWSASRSASWPTVPTLKEVGIDMVVNSPYGFAGPKGMDPKVVTILHDAIKKGMAEPSFGAALALLDQEPLYLNTEDYRAYAMREIAEQRRIVEALRLRAD